MLRRGLITAAMFGMLAVGSLPAADVVVRVAPPAPLVEHRGPPPGAGYYWTPGYHRWDGRAYVWAPGAWVRPPRPHARWVAPRWTHRHGEWVFVEGRWR